jgi:DNA-binding MarR family transcriptional regulator
MFHSALAARVGLGATEEKTLDLLQRYGPLSPGDLARHTGLAPASVTGLLDRLQRRGFLVRVRDPQDGRRLLVRVRPDQIDAIAALFDDLSRRLDEFYAGYSVDELLQATRFLVGVAAVQRAATQTLSDTHLSSEDPRVE